MLLLWCDRSSQTQEPGIGAHGHVCQLETKKCAPDQLWSARVARKGGNMGRNSAGALGLGTCVWGATEKWAVLSDIGEQVDVCVV